MPTLPSRPCPLLSPGSSPEGSLVAIRVMKHPATGGRALGTRSAAATARTHPHPARPASGRTAMVGPPPAPRPARGLPGPVSQLPRSLARTEPGPSPPAPGSQSLRPRAPSHLPYHSIPPPLLDSRRPISEREPGRTRGARGAALVLAVVLCRGRSANAGDGAARGQASLAAPRPPVPSLAWRRAGELAKAGGRGRGPRKGKSARARLTPSQPLSQREARSPASVPRRPGPAASWRADRSPRAGVGSLQLPACNVQAVLPGGRAHTRSGAPAWRRGRQGLRCAPG